MDVCGISESDLMCNIRAEILLNLCVFKIIAHGIGSTGIG